MKRLEGVLRDAAAAAVAMRAGAAARRRARRGADGRAAALAYAAAPRGKPSSGWPTCGPGSGCGYEVSSLRLFRIDLAAEARLARFASVLLDVRTDNLHEPRVYALYLRLRPWEKREVDLQAGLVPPVFGAFPRRPRSSWPSAAAGGWCGTRSGPRRPPRRHVLLWF